jgi:hypothetical protein
MKRVRIEKGPDGKKRLVIEPDPRGSLNRSGPDPRQGPGGPDCVRVPGGPPRK